MTRASIAAAIASVLVLVGAALSWQHEPARAVSNGRSGSVLSGAELFRVKGCATCHAGPDTETAGMDSLPDLSEAWEWAGGRRDGLDAEAYLRQSIEQPAAYLAPGFQPQGPLTGMPFLSVSEAEVDALVAYLLER